MKVEFTSTFNSEDNFKRICEILDIPYQIDSEYKQRFFGCNAPDVGYIIDFHGDINDLRDLAHGNLFVENLIEY